MRRAAAALALLLGLALAGCARTARDDAALDADADARSRTAAKTEADLAAAAKASATPLAPARALPDSPHAERAAADPAEIRPDAAPGGEVANLQTDPG